MKTVNKNNYEVFEYSSGYFGICEIGSRGAMPILGGDSANEDDYNREYMEERFERWDGALYDCGQYGYRIDQ